MKFHAAIKHANRSLTLEIVSQIARRNVGKDKANAVGSNATKKALINSA